MAVNIDQDLSKGKVTSGKKEKEKEGGGEERQRKPVKLKDLSSQGKGNHIEQREKLGLSNNQQYAELTSVIEKIEKAKQDDGLLELSGILGQLKGMVVDVGTEIDRRNKALNALNDDADELNSRMKGAMIMYVF